MSVLLPFPQHRLVSELGGCLWVSFLLTRHEPLHCRGRQLAACASLCAWGQPLFLSPDAAFSWLPGGDRPHLLLQAMLRCARHCCLQPAGKAGIEGCRGNEHIEALRNGRTAWCWGALQGFPRQLDLKCGCLSPTPSVLTEGMLSGWQTLVPILQKAETHLTSGVSPKFLRGC